MTEELMRLVDSLHRERDIDKEEIFQGIEQGLLAAARKTFGRACDIIIQIDRESGQLYAEKDGEPFDPMALGRIAAQTAKQVIIQKNRDSEQKVIFQEYQHRVRELVSGVVQRVEFGMVIVNLGRAEGLLPRREQVRGELYKTGDRIRCVITNVEKQGQNVRIILSRGHPELVRRLFELEVPEIGERTIEIRALVREPGVRTKVAVYSVDSRVDAVGACVGVRGSRIKNIVDELSGEKIDIIRWSDTPEVLIGNSLKPAEASEIFLYPKTRRAEVIVMDDQLSLSIGRRGQNVRLAGKLCGWNIDVFTREQMRERTTRGRKELLALPGVDDELASTLLEWGMGCWRDIVMKGEEVLPNLEGMDPERIDAIVSYSRQHDARRRAGELADRISRDVGAARRELDTILAGMQPSSRPDDGAAGTEDGAEAKVPVPERADSVGEERPA